MTVSIPMTFPSANSTEYLVSIVGGTVSLKGLILVEARLLLTRFHVLAIISSFASTSGNNKGTINNIIFQLGFAFALKDLGLLNYFLGIEIVHHVSDILLSQKKYILDLLQRADLSNCNPVSSPMVTSSSLSLDESTAFSNSVKYRQVVVSLLYVTLSQPDVTFAINKVCQYMYALAENHWFAVKRILRYLHGIPNTSLEAFSYADWAGDSDDRRPNRGFAIYLGSNLISWTAHKKRTVLRSSTEAEYKALADTIVELTWLQALLYELGIRSSSTPILWCDNLEAVSERLDIDASSSFMLTYHSDNDIVECTWYAIINYGKQSTKQFCLCYPVCKCILNRISCHTNSPNTNSVFPGSGFYQNLPGYQQMHGFPENPMYVPGFSGYPMQDPQSDSTNHKRKQVVGSPKNKKPNELDLLDDEKLRPFGEKVMGSVFRKVKRLYGEDKSSESDDESSESNEESSECDEDVEATPVENKNCKKDKFWNMPPLLKTPFLDIKLKKVIKSCTPNMLGDSTITLEDLSVVISGTIHYKVLNDEVYGKAISVGAVFILCNVSVFSLKSSDHYLNITLKNIVKVFYKDTSAVNSGYGASTSMEPYWAEEI
nr:hypothetical protein [Tanacetum cinerariifolium]